MVWAKKQIPRYARNDNSENCHYISQTSIVSQDWELVRGQTCMTHVSIFASRSRLTAVSDDKGE